MSDETNEPRDPGPEPRAESPRGPHEPSPDLAEAPFSEASLRNLVAPPAPLSLRSRVLVDLEERGVFEPPPCFLGDLLRLLTRGAVAAATCSYLVLGGFVAWSIVGQPRLDPAAPLPPAAARAWARTPDARAQAWLDREFGPDRHRIEPGPQGHHSRTPRPVLSCLVPPVKGVEASCQ